MGYNIRSLVPAVNSENQMIDTTDLIYLSNDTEFVKGYTGITYADNGQMRIFVGEYFIDEITKKDPDSVSYSLQSGFVPIIPLSKRVMRYKVTLS